MSDAPRITRRDVLGGAAAAGAGLVLGPAVARASATGGEASVFARHVGRLAPGTARLIVPGRPFSLAGVRWSAPGRARIELRARRAGGAWGPWASASVQGHDGDGVVDAGHVGEGLWTGRAAELELRCDRPVDDVSVSFVAAEARTGSDTAGAQAAAALPPATPVLPAGPGQPPIIARQAWAGPGDRPTHAPTYGEIELAFVHHTESPNGYGPGDVPGMLRAIYSFHVHGRGWWDIGYNFLVDHFGRIWEGREGGIDAPVIGAQAGDWNAISTGVAVLGTFIDAPPPPAALAALERLLAWKLSLHGLPVTGELAAVVQRSDVRYTQFRAGEQIHLPRIAGHRDADATDCPGDALYRRLPQLRPQVARLAGTPALVTLDAAVASLPSGPTLTTSGRLTRRGGAAIAGAPIQIQAIGDPSPLATATTGADGSFTATFTPRRSVLLRALHAPRPAAVSSLLVVQRAGPGVAPASLRISRPSWASSTARAGDGRARRRGR